MLPTESRVKSIVTILSDNYPVNRLGNKVNPLDEYLYITLSLRTNKKGLDYAYRQFKKEFPSWQVAFNASEKEIECAIKPAGLANQKSKNIRQAMNIIHSEFGEMSLRQLKKQEEKDVEAFLLRLPGVGLKTARCIMLFSFGFDLLPVDVHVARISQRIGWIPKANMTATHTMLENIVPEELRFTYHVCCVQHGRKTCRGAHPKCNNCCISEYCEYKQKR